MLLPASAEEAAARAPATAAVVGSAWWMPTASGPDFCGAFFQGHVDLKLMPPFAAVCSHVRKRPIGKMMPMALWIFHGFSRFDYREQQRAKKADSWTEHALENG